jgi:hypothetical protein
MNKKIHVIYISLLVIVITGFSFYVAQIEDSQDQRCWEMLKEIAGSKEI